MLQLPPYAASQETVVDIGRFETTTPMTKLRGITLSASDEVSEAVPVYSSM